MAYEPKPYPACYYRNGDSCLAEDEAAAAKLKAAGWVDYAGTAPPPSTPPPPADLTPEASPDEVDAPKPRPKRRA